MGDRCPPAPSISILPPRVPSFSMELPTLRPRSIGELLDAAFQLVRARYADLVMAALVIGAPALVLRLLLPREAVILAVWLQMFLMNFVTAAAVVIVSNVYRGREAEPREVLRRVFASFRNVFFCGLMQGMLISVGTALCVVPGVIMFILTFAMPVVAMLEGLGPSDAFDRSSRLAQGEWWRIFATMCMASLVVGLAQLAVAVLMELPGFAPAWLADVTSNLVAVLLAPFPAVVATVLYYDLRIRKEAFDLQTLMDALGPVPAQESPAL